MDGSRDHHTTGSKSERERQMPYDITYMWKLTYDTNEHIDKTETDSDIENRFLSCQGGGRWGREGLRV